MAAVAGVLTLGSCSATSISGCPGGRVRRPPPASETIFGKVALEDSPRTDRDRPDFVPDGTMQIAGREVEISSATAVYSSCTAPDGVLDCVALVSLREDGHTASAIMFWSSDRDVDAEGRPKASSNDYAIDGNDLILGPIGDGTGARSFRIPLADGLEIRTCDSGDGPAGLLDARFGATFYLDPSSGEVVRAGCNGCE